jgi:hypothetical protein
MARRETKRKLEVYSLNGHIGDAALNYRDAFKRLEKISPSLRRSLVSGRYVCILSLSVTRNSVSFVAYEGEVGYDPMILNQDRGRLRIEELGDDEILVENTHGLMDLQTRETLIEYNKKGAKAKDIAEIFSEVLSSDYGEEVEVTLTPVVDESFLQALNRFRRIRIGSVKLVRPNPDWSDEYEASLLEFAADSKAQTVNIEVSARRGQDLDRERGIIGFLRKLVRERVSNLRGGRITGQMVESEGETSISTTNFIEHQVVRVGLNQHGHVDDTEITQKMTTYLEQRKKSTHRG